MAYLALAVGAVAHRDLLLDAGVALPLLQARMDLARFFVLAPVVLAIAHLAIIAQFVLLARKAVEFHSAVRLLESTDLRSHPLRLELDSFFFAQAIAGPERSRIVGAILHGLGWLTLLLLPVALLLYLQIAFLPAHNATVTAVQRFVVLADLAVVLLAGVFLLRAEASFFGALLRLGLNTPGSMAFGLAALAGAAFVALAAGGSGSAPLFGLFPRNLDVADASLVSDRDRALPPIGGRTISLRGRDLRFARLDRADLRQADLTGANLDGASLNGADLRGARLGCIDAGPLHQPDGRARAGCTSARGADLSSAQLSGAIVAGADLRGARLDEASLERADLSHTLLTGATLEHARLQRADLSGAGLQGASLLQASLQGATLTGARLELANLSNAGLQAANLASAHLTGAVLRGADLEGAELQRAKLHGADLRGARLKAADLAGAAVWRTVPPASDAVALADIANVAIKAPAPADIDALKAALAGADAEPLGERVAGLKELVAEIGSPGWETSADGQAWTALLRASEAAMADSFKTRLADHLGRLVCRARFAEAVATAIVRRAADSAFKGDPASLHDRLKAGDCAAAYTVPRPAMLDLANAAEAAKAAVPPPAAGTQGQ
jgi:uncharacterized protein YjbI with pentapeptide repeats